MRLATLACLTVLLIASHGSAKTIYVNNQMGSDSASGLSQQPEAEHGPVRTLTAALALASKADRIVVANTGVPYYESISLSLPQHSGFRHKPFVIEGNGAVLDGTLTHDLGAWQAVASDIFSMQPRRLTYQQLFAGGVPLERVDLTSVDELQQLQPTQWTLLNGRMYFRTEDNKIPTEYNLRHAGLQTGITLYDVRFVRIENLVVQGFQQDGVNAHELVRDCQLVDVDARANGRAGLSVGGVSRVEAERSNFYDNGRVQVRTEGLAELALEACEVDDATAPTYKTGGRSLKVDGKAVLAP